MDQTTGVDLPAKIDTNLDFVTSVVSVILDATQQQATKPRIGDIATVLFNCYDRLLETQETMTEFYELLKD